MAIPALAQVLANATLAIGGNLLGETMSPLIARTAQGSRSSDPVWIPDVTSLIASFQRGHLSPGHARAALEASGVQLFGADRLNDDAKARRTSPREKYWEAAAQLLLERPAPDVFAAAYVRELIDPLATKDLARSLGMSWNDWEKVIDSYRMRLTPTDLIILRNRDLITEEQFTSGVKHYGGYDADDVKRLLKLAEQIPGISDIIRFAIREVFDPALAKSLGYYDEYPELLDKWVKAQGYGWDLGFNVSVNGNEIAANWGHLYWGAHWQTIPPTTIYRLYQRFRGDPNEEDTWRVPGVKPFTAEDVDKHLKVDDYPKPVREWLREASYTLPGRRQLGQQYRNKVIDRTELIESYRDLGFKQETAEHSADFEEIARKKEEDRPKEQRKRVLSGKIASRILRLYRQGGANEAQVTAVLHGLDWDEESIASAIALTQGEIQSEHLAEGTIAIRRSYLAGEIGDPEARGYLAALGVQPIHAQRLIARWTLLKTIPHRAATTARWIDYYRRGLVTLEQLYLALKNLGWSDPEAALNMLAAEQDRDKFLLQDREKQARTEAQRLRIQTELARRARAEQDRLKRDMMKHSSPARMRQWLIEDLITRDDVRDRLRYLEWPDNDIDKYIAETFDETLEGEPR